MTTARMTQPKKDAFLRLYAKEPNVGKAAIGAGVTRRTIYRWEAEDATFAERFHDAREEGIEELEAEAHRRALKGSDTMLIFLLKALRPQKYKDRVDISFETRSAVERLTEDPNERAAALEEVNRILAESR